MNRLIRFGKQEWPLFLIWALMVTVYSCISIFRHWHFGSNAYDLGIFDQAIWDYSRFHKPECTINGHSNLLGDHFHPILALLAPVYWVIPRVEALLAIQAVLLTVPIFPIFLFGQKRFGRIPAYLFALSYVLLWEIQITAVFDFHEICFAVALVAFVIYFADEEKWVAFFVSLFLLMMTKEDMCLLAAFIGFYLVVKRQPWKGWSLMIAGFLFFLLEIKVLIPSLSDHGYQYWSYGQLGKGPFEAILTCLFHPLKIIGLLFFNLTKFHTYCYLFLPFLFLEFFSPLSILFVPLICERMFSDYWAYWVNDQYQYNGVIAPVIVLAAIDGLYRIAKRKNMKKKVIMAVTCVIFSANLFVALEPKYIFRKSLKAGNFKITEKEKFGYGVLGLIPPDVPVLAQSPLVPYLSHRKNIYMIGSFQGIIVPRFDYVIACDDMNTWPLGGKEDLNVILSALKKNGYSKYFEKNHWVILKK